MLLSTNNMVEVDTYADLLSKNYDIKKESIYAEIRKLQGKRERQEKSRIVHRTANAGVTRSASPTEERRPAPGRGDVATPLEKAETSLRLIRSQGYERVMIFCNTKHMCQRLCDEFQRAGLDCDCIHGDIRQSQREKTMQRYRDGKLAVLIATDVASRGIDVDDVDCVINYDVPEENEYYVHRIGRTGRAKKKGVAWSIVSNFPEKARLDDICKFCNFTIQPMVMDKDGNLTPEEVKAPVTPKRRFR